jgi:Uma2 family endonuclease
MTSHAPDPGRFTTRAFNRLGGERGWDGERVELLRGMILKMSAKPIPHRAMQTDVSLAIRAGVQAAGYGWRVDQEISVDFADGFQPMPDIVVWDASAAGHGARTIPGAAVKLVVEIAAPSLEADLGPMAQGHAASGLAAYWEVDLDRRQVHRHGDPGPDGYRRAYVVKRADGFGSWTIPGLAIVAGA